MLEYFHYPGEKHTITTKDGYILEIHRIPNPGKPPVLLAHGILSSSADYIVMGPNKSLAFLLHDQKYDVWLLNYRGNRYSRKHNFLNPNNGPRFWQFSMHEIANFDLSATVDYIVSQTGQDRMFYVGHSMGTTIFWILLSDQPQYNDRFYNMQALAPVAFIGHMPSPILNQVVANMGALEVLLSMNGAFELFSHESMQRSNLKDLCLTALQNPCFYILEDLVGPGVSKLEKTILTRVFGQFPAGASLKQFSHVVQLAKSKRFAKYDYGVVDNLRRYGVTNPPSYNLKNCQVPLSLHYGLEDGIVGVKDVQYLATNLTSVVEINEVHGYNHLDFLYNFASTEFLYGPMLKTFEEFRKKFGV